MVFDLTLPVEAGVFYMDAPDTMNANRLVIVLAQKTVFPLVDDLVPTGEVRGRVEQLLARVSEEFPRTEIQVQTMSDTLLGMVQGFKQADNMVTSTTPSTLIVSAWEEYLADTRERHELTEEKKSAIRESLTPMHVGTDGSFHPMNGIATWSWVSMDNRYQVRPVIDATKKTPTIQDAEMKAIMAAVGGNKDYPRLVIHTDSLFCVRIINDMVQMDGTVREKAHFLARHFNLRLYTLLKFVKIMEGKFLTPEILWVKGHAGHPLNEQADRLARCLRLNIGLGLHDPNTKLTSTAKEMLGGIAAETSERWKAHVSL